MLRRRGDLNDTPPPATEDHESRLMAQVALGERAAFEALYRGYHPRLTRFLERMTRRPGMVEEVLNDTMLVVWRRAGTFNGTSKVSTWVFAIAYRKALKALSRVDDAVDGDEVEDTAAEPELQPEHLLGQRQLHDALMRAMNGLSAEHRAVVDLTYFHGMGYREIAEVVDCPVDTVKTRMFHARRRMRLLLGGQLEAFR